MFNVNYSAATAGAYMKKANPMLGFHHPKESSQKDDQTGRSTLLLTEAETGSSFGSIWFGMVQFGEC